MKLQRWRHGPEVFEFLFFPRELRDPAETSRRGGGGAVVSPWVGNLKLECAGDICPPCSRFIWNAALSGRPPQSLEHVYRSSRIRVVAGGWPWLPSRPLASDSLTFGCIFTWLASEFVKFWREIWIFVGAKLEKNERAGDPAGRHRLQLWFRLHFGEFKVTGQYLNELASVFIQIETKCVDKRMKWGAPRDEQRGPFTGCRTSTVRSGEFRCLPPPPNGWLVLCKSGTKLDDTTEPGRRQQIVSHWQTNDVIGMLLYLFLFVSNWA